MTPAATKAAILVKPHEPLVVAEVAIPPLGVGQVLVRIRHAGLCGKQLDEISGKRGPDPYLPHLLGHEGAGTVVETGPGVRKVKAGDSVVLHWMKGSGIESDTPTFTWQGRPVNAGWVTTFSEYTVASENRVTSLDADVASEAACLLGCAVTTGLGIVFNDAGLQPGESIVVFGAGGVGVNVVQGAALVNAAAIVAVDLYEEKLQRAREFGATHTVRAGGGDAQAFLLEISRGRGFDVAVDTTGDSRSFQLAYETTASTGRTILAGVLDHRAPVTLDAFALHFGRRIIGSHGGGTRPDRDIPRYVQLYRSAKLKLEEQITGRYPLASVNEAIESIRRGRAGKCVLDL